VEVAQALPKLPIANAGIISSVLMVLVIGWYLRQQALWFHIKLGLPMWRCWAAALVVTLVTFIIFIVALILIALIMLSQ
jgi:hypothetical protein